MPVETQSRSSSAASAYLNHLASLRPQKTATSSQLPVWKQRQLSKMQKSTVSRLPLVPERVSTQSTYVSSSSESSSSSDGHSSQTAEDRAMGATSPPAAVELSEERALAQMDTMCLEAEASLALPVEEEEDSLAALERLIDETSLRWRGSATLTRHHQLVSAPEASKEQIIASQQEEIEALRRQLQNVQYPADYGFGEEDDEDPFLEATVEQIDHVPVEHIEVAFDDDHASVTSGLTNLPLDLSRMHDDSSLQFDSHHHYPHHGGALPQLSRPEADESSHVVQDSPRVQARNIVLHAGNGVTRHAVYTGPVQPNGDCTGVGVIKFEETGDIYMGEVVQGAMHGKGTYTYKHKRRKTPFKVLRGVFDHNVFTGAEEDVVATGGAVR